MDKPVMRVREIEFHGFKIKLVLFADTRSDGVRYRFFYYKARVSGEDELGKWEAFRSSCEQTGQYTKRHRFWLINCTE